MAALKLDVGQNDHDSSVDITSSVSHDLLRSDVEDTARESDGPAPPYSTWPTAGQEEAAQRAAQRHSEPCYVMNLDEHHHSASSSGDESAVAAFSARSAHFSRKRRLRRETQSSRQCRSYYKSPPASSRSFGVCLSQAPRIAPDAFIGRTIELQQLQDWLSPKTNVNRQRIVSIVGMGGMGKTQLSLAHVDTCADDYSSVFWVNAKDETSLRQSMAQLCAVINDESTPSAAQSADDEKLKVDKVRRWLSESGNDQWLFIFDNYDDPCLPGIRSLTGYDIRSFFPTRSQGSIIITSRSPRLTFSKQLKLQKLENFNTSVAILSQRSGRDLSHGEKDGEMDV
jgi:NB-ARC domain